MFKDEAIAIAGSRSLSSANSSLVQQVVVSLVRARCNLVVGCATGADEAALSVLPPVAGKVFAAFGPGRAGVFPGGPVVAPMCSCGQKTHPY
jgi:predicted Rossmann fold nucleotide-binding protein DprA/Smf involved in DNA uptake